MSNSTKFTQLSYEEAARIMMEGSDHDHDKLTVTKNGTYTHSDPGAYNPVVVNVKKISSRELQFILDHYDQFLEEYPDGDPEPNIRTIEIDGVEIPIGEMDDSMFAIDGLPAVSDKGFKTMYTDGTNSFMLEFTASVRNDIYPGRVYLYQKITNLNTGEVYPEDPTKPIQVTMSGKIDSVKIGGVPEIVGATIRVPYTYVYQSGSTSNSKWNADVKKVGGTAEDLAHSSPYLTGNTTV